MKRATRPGPEEALGQSEAAEQAPDREDHPEQDDGEHHGDRFVTHAPIPLAAAREPSLTRFPWVVISSSRSSRCRIGSGRTAGGPASRTGSVIRPRRARRLTQGAESTQTEVVPCCIERVTAVDPSLATGSRNGGAARQRGATGYCAGARAGAVRGSAGASVLPGYGRLAPTLAFERRLGPDGQLERSRCSRDGCRSRSGSRARPHTEQPAAKGVTVEPQCGHL